MKIFVIPGDPIPWARAHPNYAKRKVYDSQKHLKIAASLYLSQQAGNDPLFEGPIHMDITFYMKVPQSISAKRRELLYGKPHFTKPDNTNMTKFYEDICSGILYHDDCIIAVTTARKIYDANPRTEFTLRELK